MNARQSEPVDQIRLPDASVRIDSMPPEGRAISLAPDGAIRAALAGALGVKAVERLAVELRATRFRGGMRVQGRLAADIVQPCVVTLEPVRQAIDEPIDRVFLPADDKAVARPADDEVFVDVEGEDLPDTFEGHEADLSDMIVETLALAIDPYPRAPGASLEGIGLPQDEPEPSPFARLQALRDRKD